MGIEYSMPEKGNKMTPVKNIILRIKAVI